MWWGAGKFSTAKFSTKLRWIEHKRVNAIIDDITSLRRRALQYASPETVSALAPWTPLPDPPKDEETELMDFCTIYDFPWLADYKVPDDGAEWDDLWREIGFGGSKEDVDSDETKPVPEGTDPWSINHLLDKIEEILEDDDEVTDERNWEPDMEESGGSSSSEAQAFSLDNPFENNVYEDLEGIISLNELENGVHLDIPATQLVQLQKGLLWFVDFRTYIEDSISQIKSAQRRHDNRYRMRRLNGDITMLMKSRGRQSPLKKVVSAEEEEGWLDPAQDWGFPKLAGYQRDEMLTLFSIAGLTTPPECPDVDW